MMNSYICAWAQQQGWKLAGSAKRVHSRTVHRRSRRAGQAFSRDCQACALYNVAHAQEQGRSEHQPLCMSSIYSHAVAGSQEHAALPHLCPSCSLTLCAQHGCDLGVTKGHAINNWPEQRCAQPAQRFVCLVQTQYKVFAVFGRTCM